MKKRKWGRIINIASAHGLVASAQKVAYVSAKHGLVGMTKVVAIETANNGITCNAICPGWVLTAAGAEADRRPRQGLRQVSARRRGRAAVGEAADAPIHQAGEYRRASGVSFERRSGQHHRLGLFDRRRLGRAVIEFLSRAFGGDKSGKPKGIQAHQSGAARRRRPWRLHLGRARPSARRRTADGRRHFRHLGRRRQCGDAGRRAQARRPGGSAQAAGRFLARGQPRRRPARGAARSHRPAVLVAAKRRLAQLRLAERLVADIFRPTISIRSTSIRSRT